MSASKAIILFLVVFLGGGVLAGGCAYSGYKSTITMDEVVKKTWADVEVVLKRRFDLIPNIVETVKGYASHEKELLQGIADSRKAYTGAATAGAKMQASSAMDSFVSRLLVIQERYPELKADKNFHALQIELEGTENRIAEMRKKYNDAASQLNSYIRAFPGSLYAGWTGVKPAEYFKAGEEAQETPKVKF